MFVPVPLPVLSVPPVSRGLEEEPLEVALGPVFVLLLCGFVPWGPPLCAGPAYFGGSLVSYRALATVSERVVYASVTNLNFSAIPPYLRSIQDKASHM